MAPLVLMSSAAAAACGERAGGTRLFGGGEGESDIDLDRERRLPRWVGGDRVRLRVLQSMTLKAFHFKSTQSLRLKKGYPKSKYKQSKLISQWLCDYGVWQSQTASSRFTHPAEQINARHVELLNTLKALAMHSMVKSSRCMTIDQTCIIRNGGHLEAAAVL